MRPGRAGEAQLRRRLKKRKAHVHARQEHGHPWQPQLMGDAKREEVRERLTFSRTFKAVIGNLHKIPGRLVIRRGE